MRRPAALRVFAFLAFAVSVRSQDKSDKFAVFVTGMDDAAPVVQSLIKKLNDSKPFEAVTKKDPSKLVVMVSCMPRKQPQPDLFACMYVAQYNGATFKSFMGGGLFLTANADVMADNLLRAIAQDVVERYESTNTDNLRDALQTCLLMTDSKCNVPDPLQKEFDAKQLTLGQYLMKKNQ